MVESANLVSRRGFIKTAAAGAAGAATLALGVNAADSRPAGASLTTDINKPGNHHLAWVWQFDDDGSPEQIRSALAFMGMGILLKTHDSTTWMAKWDKSGRGMDSSIAVRVMADFFESGGVPFHAWAVVKGKDPIGEAHMAAEVLRNGARSLVLDLEPSDGGYYWQGTPQTALEFGRELRRLQPNAFLSMAPDPRPWQVDALPCREFATFCNEIAPQTYWPMFDNSANYRLMRERGFHVGPEGVTPEVILDMTRATFEGYNLPIKPVGTGNASNGDWQRFVGHAQSLGMSAVSVWRFGTAREEIWPVVAARKPQFNAYYGADWNPNPIAAAPAARQEPFASLPPIAQETGPKAVVVGSREATSAAQGVHEDLDALTRPTALANSTSTSNRTKPQIKSFWADPLGTRSIR